MGVAASDPCDIDRCPQRGVFSSGCASAGHSSHSDRGAGGKGFPGLDSIK